LQIVSKSTRHPNVPSRRRLREARRRPNVRKLRFPYALSYRPKPCSFGSAATRFSKTLPEKRHQLRPFALAQSDFVPRWICQPSHNVCDACHKEKTQAAFPQVCNAGQDCHALENNQRKSNPVAIMQPHTVLMGRMMGYLSQ